MKRSTLLINVSLRPESKVKLFPIGIGYIATAMQRAGYSFDILDIDAHRYSREEVDAFVAEKKYDIVCLGCLVTGYKLIKDLCGRIRNIHPNSTIIVGNSVATSIYEILLTKTEADIVVMHEGDVTVADLLDTLSASGDLNNVAGIVFKQDNRLIKTTAREAIQDISSLPFIDYSLFETEVYVQNSPEQLSSAVPLPRETMRTLPVNTARGCVGQCVFCYHNFQGYGYRYRSVESILTEIAGLQKQYRLNHISFWDELTFFSRQRAIDFVEGIQRSNLTFFWEAQCRADIFSKDSDVEILRQMKEAGCVSFGFGLESTNKDILTAMHKRVVPDQIERSVELAHKAGLLVNASVIVGFPGETLETIRDTFAFCAKRRIYPSAGYLLPQPGSKTYEYAKQHGFIRDEEDYLLRMGDRQDLRLNMTDIPDAEMEQAVLEGLRECNRALGIELPDESLIKTQYYRTPKKEV